MLTYPHPNNILIWHWNPYVFDCWGGLIGWNGRASHCWQLQGVVNMKSLGDSQGWTDCRLCVRMCMLRYPSFLGWRNDGFWALSSRHFQKKETLHLKPQTLIPECVLSIGNRLLSVWLFQVTKFHFNPNQPPKLNPNVGLDPNLGLGPSRVHSRTNPISSLGHNANSGLGPSLWLRPTSHIIIFYCLIPLSPSTPFYIYIYISLSLSVFVSLFVCLCHVPLLLNCPSVFLKPLFL